MKWTEYWAPGVKFQYPAEFNLKEEYYYGDVLSNQVEKQIKIDGIVIGKNDNTNQKVETNLSIFVREPKFIDEKLANNFMYDENKQERESFTNNRGVKWWSFGIGEDSPTRFSKAYTCVEQTTDGSYTMVQIEFVTNNIDGFENDKVINIINMLLGSTKLTSW